ncbi:suppressor of fused domain protein [Methylomonas methanica]|uniref:Suppressor of fused-like domain-containing protein n=1 Tax=Methylomonas methanica (strain DSM 25384 / MC09) TaxID=857087 RepID=G0A0J8_METMM|nr:suppressor of fused domain protein [Methylomonas methanica]AEF98774.1 hypothetical protein Metme_0327 [Methylomonas methanica MC09]
MLDEILRQPSEQRRNQTVLKHYQSFFKDHKQELLTWDIGPIKELVPSFQVFRAEPGPQINLWSYASIGANNFGHDKLGLLEFIVHSPIESPTLVETMGMITHYHANRNLGFGHSMPIGEPWLDGSECNHWLISKRYPLGAELEICNIKNTHIHVALLLPITEAENKYKAKNGLEALEKLFEDKGLEYWNIRRKSLV